MFSRYYWEDKGYKRLRMRKENSVQRPPSIYTLFPPCLVTMTNTRMSHKNSLRTFHPLLFPWAMRPMPFHQFLIDLKFVNETSFIRINCGCAFLEKSPLAKLLRVSGLIRTYLMWWGFSCNLPESGLIDRPPLIVLMLCVSWGRATSDWLIIVRQFRMSY